MDVRCSSLTKEGKPCSNRSKEAGKCHVHCKTVSSSIKSSSIAKRSPPVRSPSPKIEKRKKDLQLLEKEWRRRGIESPGMGSLEWSPTGNYYFTPIEEAVMKQNPKQYPNPRPYSEDFVYIANKLIEICSTIGYGSTIIHPRTPAVQWTNNNVKVVKIRKKILHKEGNHYGHKLEADDNKNYPDMDKYYCMCNEYQIEKSAFNTLKGDVDWNDIHGEIYTSSGQEKRNVNNNLKEKIKKDSIEVLALEYKIHLQPKPEYQFSVVRELVKLLKNEAFSSKVEVFKVAIPYHRVKSELNLPVIVIYPMPGKEDAIYVLNTIIEHFSQFDSEEIGLDHTPRFNKKINELIYVAGGSGDHKKHLPASLFNGPGKEFYKGFEI